MRANATLLFCEAFPIHDPNLGSQAIETAIQKQLDTAMVKKKKKTVQNHANYSVSNFLCGYSTDFPPPQDLLNDPHPTVRCMAILGVCKILAKFWELFPPGIIMDFLKKLAGELANDTSSEEVRSSVFKVEGALLFFASEGFEPLRAPMPEFLLAECLTWCCSQCLALVLDNPLSHPVLEKLIPTIKNSLHDKSEMTRVTFLDMLIKMKEVRAAKVRRVLVCLFLSQIDGNTSVTLLYHK